MLTTHNLPKEKFSSWEELYQEMSKQKNIAGCCSAWIEFQLPNKKQASWYVRVRNFRPHGKDFGKAFVLANINFHPKGQGYGYFKDIVTKEIFPLCEKEGILCVWENSLDKVSLRKKTQDPNSMWYGFLEIEGEGFAPSTFYKQF